MVNFKTLLWCLTIGQTAFVQAHPGHDAQAEAIERAAALKNRRGLDHCADTFSARSLASKNIMRRDLAVQQIRQQKGVKGVPSLVDRDLGVLNKTHHSHLDVDFGTDPETLFSSNATCILTPEVSEGPYFVAGELIRENVVEDQFGIPLYLDVQLVDSSTCEPVPHTFIEMWQCNSTGIYSGIVAVGNGDLDDKANINTTFLRGVQETDEDGVVRFESLFPGHYTGRATHVHILAHDINDTVRFENDTVSGHYTTNASSISQIFFDQELISKVERYPPYASNTQPLTLNSDDIYLIQEAEGDHGIDPIVEYVYVNGNDVSDGVFAWISLAIDPTNVTTIIPAGDRTPSGGWKDPTSPWAPGPPNTTSTVTAGPTA